MWHIQIIGKRKYLSQLNVKITANVGLINLWLILIGLHSAYPFTLAYQEIKKQSNNQSKLPWQS
jgi:hypothetical protein